MTAPHLIANDAARVKAEILDSLSRLLDPILEAANLGTLTPREAEQRTWVMLVHLGAMVLSSLFAALCLRKTAHRDRSDRSIVITQIGSS